jgi:hypothetical protein
VDSQRLRRKTFHTAGTLDLRIYDAKELGFVRVSVPVRILLRLDMSKESVGEADPWARANSYSNDT